MHVRQIHAGPYAELQREIRAFLGRDPIDRTGFVHLVELLHALPMRERRVAYDHLLQASLESSRTLVRAVARLADLVGADPPDIGSDFGHARRPRRR
jgi:hypothetical protein